MQKYGLIGNPVKHSLSPELFHERFGKESYCYELIETAELGDLRALVKASGLNGFNLTSPFKQEVAGQLDRITPSAQAVGAVNCVKVEEEGKLVGYNTDCKAFGKSIERYGLDGSKAMVLGSGGAARAVATALREQGVECKMVSRNPEGETIGYEEAYARAGETRLIVNATPVGMAGSEEESVWNDWSKVGPNHIFYDLIYRPKETMFLRLAREHGATTKNGEEMLRLQAEESWRVWGLI